MNILLQTLSTVKRSYNVARVTQQQTNSLIVGKMKLI
jgi:hypothetical protein